MQRFIFPENINKHVTAFFTGKDPGSDIDIISNKLKISPENFFLPIQKHTDTVVVLESSREPRIADSVVTRERGVVIGVRVADCAPVLVYERARGIIGAVHAGWKGTAEGILQKTIETIFEKFAGNPEDIVIAIGPSIRWCCYEVDYDVFTRVKHASGEGDYFRKKGDRYCLDLASANRQQALSIGVPEANIWISEDCTFCYPERYYSYRYSRGTTGRQGGFIGLD